MREKFINELKKEYYSKLGIFFRGIDAENEEADIKLREGNTYFYSTVEGMEICPPDEEHPYEYCRQDEIEIRKDRYLLPEGMTAESKLYFGLFDDEERFLPDGRCLAIVDLVMGYPTEEYVYIGWLILENEVHGVGLAAGIMDVIYSVSRKLGYKFIKLSAYDVNEPGMKFWTKQGFRQEGFVMRKTGKGELKLNKFIKEI